MDHTRRNALMIPSRRRVGGVDILGRKNALADGGERAQKSEKNLKQCKTPD